MNIPEIRMHIGYCYMLPSRQVIRWLFLCLMALWDIIFQSLMGRSSGYMAFHLHKHHKCAFYLHSSKVPSNSSLQFQLVRATLTVILLTCFLFFYWSDFILSFYTGFIMMDDSTVINIKIFLVIGYVNISPFVLIIRNVCVAKY
jgi:vomeronasal1 receptor